VRGRATLSASAQFWYWTSSRSYYFDRQHRPVTKDEEIENRDDLMFGAASAPPLWFSAQAYNFRRSHVTSADLA
jgi:hypothetical protein